MSGVDSAVETQARNIERATGQSMATWVALVKARGNERHTDIVVWLKATHGFSHGNANLVALTAKRGARPNSSAELVDAIYAGPKSTLRSFHDQVIETTRRFGPDVELAPKQAYVSLRRSKQFGTVGPGPGGRLEIGLNLAGVRASGPARGHHRDVHPSRPADVDRRARQRGHRVAPERLRACVSRFRVLLQAGRSQLPR